LPNNSIADTLNACLLHRTLEKLMQQLDMRDPVWWVGIPSRAVLKTIDQFNARFLVYDCIDNFASFHKKHVTIDRTERLVASKAKMIFATSAKLAERMSQINPQTYLVPNAVDFEHFAMRNPPCSIPADMAQIKPPILGYFGELADWFDFDLVIELAKHNPSWSIVLIGQTHVAQAKNLFHLANVHYLGRKEYVDLPAYLHHFDVCLLPFKVNEFTASINPVKLYEYMASGKPIVSTPINEVNHFRGIIEVADREMFSNTVRRVLDSNADPKHAERVETARQNTWDRRIEQIAQLLSLN
jgi:glycosyltransferase involved in cell wall biosynthesis